MVIAIKSEMDSRVVLYPLMKACNTFGSVIVLSSNRYVKRMIDDQEYSTFKNIAILVDETGATDEICEAYDIVLDEYDYVIMDNIGVTEYDKLLVLFGQKSSDSFEEDIQLYKSQDNNENIFFLQYGGKGKAATKERAPKEDKAERRLKKSNKDNGIPDDYDPEQKFKDMVIEEKKKKIKEFDVSLPKFEMIEKLEGLGQFEAVDEKLSAIFYELFGGELNIQYNLFRKEIRQTNESGSSNKSGRSGR